MNNPEKPTVFLGAKTGYFMGNAYDMAEIGCRVEIIKEKRKTISARIRNGMVIVKAPYRVTEPQIREFLVSHKRWIRIHMDQAENTAQAAQEAGRLSMEEIRTLADQAVEEIPKRVKHYASLMGVTYGKITIRNQKTRWGSCSKTGNLNFNCLLMLAPPQVLDAVVVHELAHRKEMNHSPRFYREIEKVYPEYEKWNRWLKENGAILLKRMSG